MKLEARTECWVRWFPAEVAREEKLEEHWDKTRAEDK